MYNIGICDDEKSTCAELESMILEYKKVNQLQMETEVWYSGESLCNEIYKNNEYDLIFLDIELMGLNGVEVGNFIRDELEDYRTLIVYISSKMNYAMQLFETQPFDFLIKPISQKQVNEVLNKSLKRWEKGKQFFEFQIGGTQQKVLYEDIIYFCSENRKVKIHTKNQGYEFYGKLKEIFCELPINFTLIHQSYIVNQDYIKRCTYEEVQLADGKTLAISRRYRAEVREKIKQYQRERDKRSV